MFLKTLVIPAISVIHGWKAVSLSSEDILLNFFIPHYLKFSIKKILRKNELYLRSYAKSSRDM